MSAAQIDEPARAVGKRAVDSLVDLPRDRKPIRRDRAEGHSAFKIRGARFHAQDGLQLLQVAGVALGARRSILVVDVVARAHHADAFDRRQHHPAAEHHNSRRVDLAGRHVRDLPAHLAQAQTVPRSFGGPRSLQESRPALGAASISRLRRILQVRPAGFEQRADERVAGGSIPPAGTTARARRPARRHARKPSRVTYCAYCGGNAERGDRGALRGFPSRRARAAARRTDPNAASQGLPTGR